MSALLWLFAVPVVAVAAVLLFPGIVLDPWFRRMLRPPLRAPRGLPAAMARWAEDVTISGPLMPIKAWLVWPGAREGGDGPAGTGARPASGAKGVVGLAVFVHGWSSDGGRMAPLARHLLDAGVACLLVDLPGHGRTGRTPSYNVKLMVEDLAAVRGWISTRGDLATLRSAILGYSFGGLGAMVAVARDRRWNGLVMMAAPVGPMEAIEIYLERMRIPARLVRGALRKSAVRVIGVDPDAYAGPRNLPELRVPALFVHGSGDEVVPCHHAERLHASAPRGLAELAIVDGAGHDGLLVDAEAGRRVAAFLGRVMSEARAPVRGDEG